MEFQDVVHKRRMVRHFTNEPVEIETIQRILKLACHSPSAGFTQGQSYVVVTHLELKQKLAELCGEQGYVSEGFDPFISGAPLLVVVCTSEAAYHRRYQEPDKVDANGIEIKWPVPYWFMDIGCAAMIVLLAVVDEGLAAGFAGFDDLPGVRDLLKLPEEVIPMGVIPIGHAAPDKRSESIKRGRKPMTETVHWEGW